MTWADDARAAIVAAEQLLDVAAAEIADLQTELAECKAANDHPPEARSVLGFAGPDPTGKARVLRVYLNPGDPFPKPAPGVLHFVTYKGPSDHAQRASEAKAYAAPLLLGFHHEPEGPGGPDYTPTAYKAHWVTLTAELKKQGVANVRTVWVMMAASFTGSASDHANAYYPGDGLVDVVGADGYDWCGCKTGGTGYASGAHRGFATVFKGTRDFAKAHGNKPVAIGEFGTPQRKDGNESERVAWINDAVAVIKADPSFVAACYFQHGMPAFACEWTLKGASLDAYAAAL
jgi:hypothetical protein